MAQPWTTTVGSVTDGLLDSVVAYGYKMSGTSVTACTAATQVTTTLYTATTKVFTGAKYQSVTVQLSPKGDPAANTIDRPLYASLSNTGADNSVFTANTVQAYIITNADGIIIGGTQNAYWDFLQTNVFQAQTMFGRGGGATGGPCGWWVFYSFEVPFLGAAISTDPVTANYLSGLTNSGVTVSMWTDNSIATTVGAAVLAGLATILY